VGNLLAEAFRGERNLIRFHLISACTAQHGVGVDDNLVAGRGQQSRITTASLGI